MKKIFTLAMAAAFIASASADELQIFSAGPGTPGMDAPQLSGMAISPDGSYICGTIEYGYGGFVASTKTGEVHYFVDETESDDGCTLLGVANNGFGVGYTKEGISYDFQTKELGDLFAPEGFSYTIPESVNADGSMIVGSVKFTDGYIYPAFTTDREQWNLLPLPTKEELGNFVPKSAGGTARRVSGDGNVMLGHLGSFEMPIVWVRNADGDYEADFFLTKFLKDPQGDDSDPAKELISISAQYLGLSANGKYAVMLGLIDHEGNRRSVPVVYNVEEKTLKIYKETQSIDADYFGLYPWAIANDGTFVGTIGVPYYGSCGSFIMEAGKEQAETYEEAFPKYYEELGVADRLGMNVVTGISADARYIVGYTFFSEDYQDANAYAYYLTYVIDRGEDAAVEGVKAETATAIESIFTLDGRKISAPVKGINIVRMTDGSAHKVIVK